MCAVDCDCVNCFRAVLNPIKDITGKELWIAHYKKEKDIIADLSSVIKDMQLIGSNLENSRNISDYILNYIEVLQDDNKLRLMYIKLLMEKMKHEVNSNVGNLNL